MGRPPGRTFTPRSRRNLDLFSLVTGLAFPAADPQTGATGRGGAAYWSALPSPLATSYSRNPSPDRAYERDPIPMERVKERAARLIIH